ncbi:MAG: hypothetical protein WCO65_00600 [bacterium]
MEAQNKTLYQVLDGFPPYGPTPVSVGGQAEYSEGYVVKLFKEDGDFWIANFKWGLSNFEAVYEYPEQNLILIFAGGRGYLMNPNETTPVKIFDHDCMNAIKIEDGRLVLYGPCEVQIIETNWDSWMSKRISWDGFENVVVDGDLIKGLSFNAVGGKDNEWVPFSVNMKTKEITGGGYQNLE